MKPIFNHSPATAGTVDKSCTLRDSLTCRWIPAINRLMRVARRAILAPTSDYNIALEVNEKHNEFTYAFPDGRSKINYNKTRT